MRRALKATLIGSALAVLAGGGVAFASGGGGGGTAGGGGGGRCRAPRAPATTRPPNTPRRSRRLKANNYKDAARAAGHVTDAVPTNPDAWRLLGMAKAGDNDWKGSRRAYEKAVKLTPDDAERARGPRPGAGQPEGRQGPGRARLAEGQGPGLRRQLPRRRRS